MSRLRPFLNGPLLAQAVLPFALILYLGMRDGGYGEIVRGEVGIAVWWVVLITAAIGVLPTRRLGRAEWAGFGLFLALAVWTGLGIGWSESAERSVAELGRVASLLGVFVLALLVQGPGSLARMLGGVASGIAVIGLIALLSRLQPLWFPVLEIPKLNEGAQARLHYPLNYWNGLAAFMAMGIPLVLAAGTYFQHLAVRAVCIAVVPALALTTFFTLSRGGAVEAGVALAVLFALHPSRIELAASAALAGIAAALLIWAASRRPELMDGLDTATGVEQGSEMLALTLVVCASVGGIAVALGRWSGGRTPTNTGWRPSKKVVAGAIAVVVGVSLVIGVPGALSDGWEDFKESGVPTSDTARFDALAGGGRYQWWSAAVDANATDPLLGIGPGTFEFWWARESTLPTFVREAHSLYLQTLAELGVVGLVLVIALVGMPIAVGLKRLRSVASEQRELLAAAIAACVAFAIAAALEWVWELTVVPVAFLLLAAAILGLQGGREPSARASERPRIFFTALALCGLIATAIPTAGALAIRNSQEAVTAQDLPEALDRAGTASDIQPYSATASLQKALVLELQGNLDDAAAAAGTATELEPTNWRTWLVLSRLEYKLGNDYEALAAYRAARSLNPNSPLFGG